MASTVVNTKSSTRTILGKVNTHRSTKGESVKGRYRVYSRDQFGGRHDVSTVTDAAAALARVRTILMDDVNAVMAGKSADDRERANTLYQTVLAGIEKTFRPKVSPVYFTLNTASGMRTYFVEEII